MLFSRSKSVDRAVVVRRIDRGQAVALSILCLLVILWLGGCWGHRHFNVSESSLPTTMTTFVQQNPEHFSKPVTLVLLLDTSPCGKAFAETRWWKEWKKHTEQANCGFLFATNRDDSSDVAVAAQLDGAEAPILIFPPDKFFMSRSDIHSAVLPMKLLVDREGKILQAYGYLPDTSYSNRLMRDIDDLSASYGSTSRKTGE